VAKEKVRLLLNFQSWTAPTHEWFPSGRYNEIFFMIDTCQANTMFSKFYSPNILATGSSQLGENSYSVIRLPLLCDKLTLMAFTARE
jgi:glycosylphosphatidylinositol transamidase (GPIT) subunit GPI8